MTTDFDFMEVNLNDAIDLKSVPDGTEAKIQIMDAEPNGEKCYVRCRMKITNQGEGIKSFSHFLSYPKPEDEAETKNNKLLRIRTFLQAFRIDEGQRSNPAAWVGQESWAILREEADDQYGIQNSVKKFVTGS